MKKVIIPAIFAAISMFSLSCKKSEDTTAAYTCQTCKKTPDALAVNDASSKGVYKGVVTGSSGTIMFDILNGGTTVTATLVLDGVTSVLTSNVTWTATTAYVGVFTGTLSGSPVSITFSVNANGTNPTVTAYSIPGHPGAQFDVVKETSQNLVECFEGTYSSTSSEKGSFNLLLSRSAKIYGGSSRANGTVQINSFDGIINASNKLKDNDTQTIMATLTGDEIAGTFQDSNNSTVTLYAKRTW